MKDEKIDLVYTWVDDTDKVWLEKRKKYVSNYILEKESNDNCRFSNYDELKYSLRSVEKYAPWINHIFIVTAGQVPNWLDFNNPKTVYSIAYDKKFCLKMRCQRLIL